MKIGIAADHGGYDLKVLLHTFLTSREYEVQGYGAYEMNSSDDYPDFVVPLGKAIASGEMERDIAVCGSGVGASVAANKLAGVRAALINNNFSAHQGVRMTILTCFAWVGESQVPWRLRSWYPLFYEQNLLARRGIYVD